MDDIGLGTPPIEGVNGWITGLAVTLFLSVCGQLWAEYKRRAAEHDRRITDQATAADNARKETDLAEIRIKAEAAAKDIEIRDKMFDRIVTMNDKQSAQLQAVMTVNNEQSIKILHLMDELSTTKEELSATIKQLERLLEEKEINEKEIRLLNDRIDQLEREVKSLEQTRDEEKNRYQ